MRKHEKNVANKLVIPWQEEIVQVFENGLDVEVGLFDDGLRYGISWRHQGHDPVCVDVHTQLHRVAVQRQGQAITQHLHGPFHLMSQRTEDMQFIYKTDLTDMNA